MGVASGCGEQVGVAIGSGWNLWVWLLGVVLRRYIDFLILLIPTPLVSVHFYSSIPTFCSFFTVQCTSEKGRNRKEKTRQEVHKIEIIYVFAQIENMCNLQIVSRNYGILKLRANLENMH